MEDAIRQFVRCAEADILRQIVEEDPPCLLDRCRANGIDAPKSPRPLDCCRQHEHHAINDTPGNITAKRGKEDAPDRLTIACGDTDCSGEGKRHEQTKDDLREAVYRLQDRSNARRRGHPWPAISCSR